MTTEAEVYEALRYCVEVDPKTGACRYRNAAGRLHREDGPAVVYPNSQKFWFIEDCAVSQEKFNEYVSRIADEVSRNLAS